MPSDGIPAANTLFVASIAKGFRVLECIAHADGPPRIGKSQPAPVLTEVWYNT